MIKTVDLQKTASFNVESLNIIGMMIVRFKTIEQSIMNSQSIKTHRRQMKIQANDTTMESVKN